VKWVIVVGPGAAGKTTLAARLAEITGLSLIELDKLFWRPGLAATPPGEWAAIQRKLAARESWIMDGDLGPYDVVDVRLQAADTVVFLDFAPLRCAWRAIRRSRERADFWRWLLSYRSQSRCATPGGCRARRSPRRLRPPDPARGEAIRHEDGVRRVCATLRSRRMKRHTGTPPDSRQIRTFARGRRCINIEIDRYTLIITGRQPR
jgi:hypothetical protein